MSDPVLYQLRNQTAWITLNRPENHNALGASLTRALAGALARARDDGEARMVVLAAAGRSFCAGLDLKGDGGGFAGNEDEDGLPPYQSLVRTLWEFPKPVVCRVQGSAFGGGFGLIVGCDVAVTVPTARFAVTELRFGVPPTTIPLMLHHKGLIGPIRPMLLTGITFDARAALDYRVVHRIVEPDALDGAVEEWLGEFRRAAPKAFAEAKAIQRTIPGLSFRDGLHHVTERLGAIMKTGEAAEGRRAFMEKRDPRWWG